MVFIIKIIIKIGLINIGLIIDIFGIILLLWYSYKTGGAPDQGTKDHLASRWWFRCGYLLLGIGFLIQIIGNSVG